MNTPAILILAAALLLAGCQTSAPCTCSQPSVAPVQREDGGSLSHFMAAEVTVEYHFTGGYLAGLVLTEKFPVERPDSVTSLPVRDHLFDFYVRSNRPERKALGVYRVGMTFLPPPSGPTGAKPPLGQPPPQRGSSSASSPAP